MDSVRMMRPTLTSEEFNSVYDAFKIISKLLQKDGLGADHIINKKSDSLEQYDKMLVRLFEIPLAVERMRCLEFRFRSSFDVENIKGGLQAFVDVSKILTSSLEFKEFLSFVLNVANYLNQNDSSFSSNKENVVLSAINIRSLSALASLKSKVNREESLLDVVYRLIDHKAPQMLVFAEQLSPIKKIVGVKVEFLDDQFKELKSDLAFLVRSVQTFQKSKKSFVDEKEWEAVCQNFDRMIPDLNFEILDIKRMFVEVEKHFQNVAKLYAQDYGQMDSFFVDLASFLTEFEACRNYFVRNKNSIPKLLTSKRKEEQSGSPSKLPEVTSVETSDDVDVVGGDKSKKEEIEKMFNSFNATYQTIQKGEIEKAKRKKKKEKKSVKNGIHLHEILQGHTQKIEFFSKINVKLEGMKSYEEREVVIIGSNCIVFDEDGNVKIPIAAVKHIKVNKEKRLMKLKTKKQGVKLHFPSENEFSNVTKVFKKIRAEAKYLLSQDNDE